MTNWMATEDVLAHLGISRDALTALLRAPVDAEKRAWVLYAGEHGRRSARYRWRADRVDGWFEEAASWRASSEKATDGRFGGETADEEAEPTSRPSRRGSARTRSPRRSKTSSSGSGGTSLVELADRLTSR